MHIVFDDALQELGDKFMVLELDTFRDPINGHTRTAWCVVENIPLEEMPVADSLRQAHQDLMQSYREQQWQRCHNAIGGLMGRWNRELDSFYEIMIQRVQSLEQQCLPADWDSAVPRNLPPPL
jgi:hypothetical protein